MLEEVSASPDDQLSPSSESNKLGKLRRYLDNKSCSCCFDLRPLARAQVVGEREMSGYIAHLWTLNENRWISQIIAPFYGDEALPERPVGNIWEDYHFDGPANTVLDKEESQEIVQDLKETQHRERCSKCECLGEIKCTTCLGSGRQDCDQCHQQGVIECCHDETCGKCKGEGFYPCIKCSENGRMDCTTCHTRGRIPCPDCKGLRFILHWTQLHVKWENHHSLITRDSGNSSILPTSTMEKSSGKVTCLEFDDTWSSSTQSVDNVLNSCVELPNDLRSNIHENYRKEHCDKSKNIIRLRCIIERLYMKEIDYAFDQRPNETYTFCIYGEDGNHVYDNQYPYKCCGRSSCTLL